MSLIKNILCPKCNNYPLLSLNKDKLKDILIQCKHCGFNQSDTLHNYLQSMKIFFLNKNEECNQCIQHKLEYNNYCLTCKAHICNQCINHQSHKLISLDKVLSKTKFDDIMEKGYNHIHSYCNELKIKKIKEYLLMINKIELSYQSFQTINNDIIQLFKLISEFYYTNKSNYYLKLNYININDLNIYKNTNENTLEGIVNYYNSYIIIKGNPIIADISNITQVKHINEYSNYVYCVVLLSDGRLASCSRDKTIKIYNIKNDYNCDIIIEEHTKDVTYLCQLNNNKLISCSSDKSIKIWSITQFSYECDYTLKKAHNGFIYKVISLTNNRIASCSEDKTIKIWNSNHPYEYITSLEGHLSYVTSIIQVIGKVILISGSDDSTLRSWDLITYKTNKILSNVYCCDSNSLMEIDDCRLVVGEYNSIAVVNINDYIIEKRINNIELKGVRSLMILRDNNVLCGCDNGVMCIYDINMNNINKENKLSDESFFDLISINEYQFLSCSCNSNIQLWKY